jgi:hypothetical protein
MDGPAGVWRFVGSELCEALRVNNELVKCVTRQIVGCWEGC